MNTTLKRIVGLLTIVAVVCGGILAIHTWWWEIFQVPTASMSPTLRSNDLVLVNKRAYNNRVPTVGEMVVFRHPLTQQLYVKRVIAKPGDAVLVIGGSIWVNTKQLETTTETQKSDNWDGKSGNFLLQHQRLSNGVRYRTLVHEKNDASWKLSGYWEVPSDAIFVMGDWRDNSSDSREWGVIPLGNIVGKVSCIQSRTAVQTSSRFTCNV